MTTTTVGLQTPRTWQVSSEAQALMEKFPPRPVPGAWPRTRESRVVLEDRMAAAPFRGDDSQSRCHRKACLIDIRDNLTSRIAEAEREGWLGEADGLRVSLAAAKEKLAHADASLQRRVVAVELGMPSFRDVAARTVTT